jgi:hypothetical protein
MYNEQVFEQDVDEGSGYLLRTDSKQKAERVFHSLIANWGILLDKNTFSNVVFDNWEISYTVEGQRVYLWLEEVKSHDTKDTLQRMREAQFEKFKQSLRDKGIDILSSLSDTLTLTT